MGTYERKVDLPTSASPRRRIVTSGASVAIMIESGQILAAREAHVPIAPWSEHAELSFFEGLDASRDSHQPNPYSTVISPTCNLGDYL